MVHRCGGELMPQKVKIQKKVSFYHLTFTVDGFKCNYCGDEIISRDVALQIDETVDGLRNLWKNWRIPQDTRLTGTASSEQVFVDDNYAVRV